MKYLNSLKNIFLVFLVGMFVTVCRDEKKADIQRLEILYRFLKQAEEEVVLNMKSFFFLTPYSVGLIGETEISLTVPNGTNVSALVASFSHNGLFVSVNGVKQSSGTTPNDFTNPVTYTITGNNGATKSYTITVKIGAQ